GARLAQDAQLLGGDRPDDARRADGAVHEERLDAGRRALDHALWRGPPQPRRAAATGRVRASPNSGSVLRTRTYARYPQPHASVVRPSRSFPNARGRAHWGQRGAPAGWLSTGRAAARA